MIGTTLQIVGESLAEACDLRWDEAALDVARRLGPGACVATLLVDSGLKYLSTRLHRRNPEVA